MRLAPFALTLSLLAACTSEHHVGSTCPDGVCTGVPSPPSTMPCLLDTTNVFPEIPSPGSPARCIKNASIELVNGMAPCRAFFSIGVEEICDELGLPVYDDGIPETNPECELPQLSPDMREAPDTDDDFTGWYFEDARLASDPCWQIGTHRLEVNNGNAPSDLRFRCTTALAHFSDVEVSLRRGEQPVMVSAERCGGLPGLPMQTPEDIDDWCKPRVDPPGGFSTTSMYIDARTEQCSSGVCLIDGTSAPLVTACEDPDLCSATRDFAAASYCSCRCDPKGDNSRPACECPEDFECRDVLNGEAPDTLAGGYCLRKPR
jgi:hypothetical protein